MVTFHTHIYNINIYLKELSLAYFLEIFFPLNIMHVLKRNVIACGDDWLLVRFIVSCTFFSTCSGASSSRFCPKLVEAMVWAGQIQSDTFQDPFYFIAEKDHLACLCYQTQQSIATINTPRFMPLIIKLCFNIWSDLEFCEDLKREK